MLAIGLTGGIGSGKTTVANLFAEYGITIIDTDVIAKELVQPHQEAFDTIINHFGTTLLDSEGKLIRSELRKIIFSNLEERVWLENLLHPLIRQETNKQIRLALSPYCIVVIPLLFETSPNPHIQRILVIDSSEKQQMYRTKQRDNAPEEGVAAIMRSQVTRDKRLALANDIIHNNGTFAELIPQVKSLHELYLSLAKNF